MLRCRFDGLMGSNWLGVREGGEDEFEEKKKREERNLSSTLQFYIYLTDAGARCEKHDVGDGISIEPMTSDESRSVNLWDSYARRPSVRSTCSQPLDRWVDEARSRLWVSYLFHWRLTER